MKRVTLRRGDDVFPGVSFRVTHNVDLSTLAFVLANDCAGIAAGTYTRVEDDDELARRALEALRVMTKTEAERRIRDSFWLHGHGELADFDPADELIEAAKERVDRWYP